MLYFETTFSSTVVVIDLKLPIREVFHRVSAANGKGKIESSVLPKEKEPFFFNLLSFCMLSTNIK